MPSVADNPARCRDVGDAMALEMNATIAVTNESDNSAITPARFTASRTYGVEYTNEELKTLRVDVRVPMWMLEAESHGGSEDHYQIEIALQQWAQDLAKDKAQVDLLSDLTGRVARYFCPKRILGAYGNVQANQVLVVETMVQLYNPDKIKQGRYFGLVTVTMKEYVDR